MFVNATRFIDPQRLILNDVYNPRPKAPSSQELLDEEIWDINAIVTMLYHDPEFFKKLNKWLPNLGLNFKMSMTDYTNRGKPTVSLNANDKTSGAANIDLQDLGFGAANALRILVALLTLENKIIFLGEPEQNLHPSVHMKFAELILESIEKKGNRFFIETHSENLCLKILQMVQKKNLHPDFVIINVTERNKRGSKINQIKVGPDGSFQSPWPEPGFFSDRYSLLK